MAGALRELIELLLTEIAISGTDGTRLAEIWELVNAFHNGQISGVHESFDNPPNFHLDRALQEDLWEWLTLNPEVSVGQAKKFNGLTLSEAEEVDSQSPDLRLFVSEDRIWKALTGHEKDETKVPSTEFALLSIIASCRSQGILQTELVRRSGQDSRSVPKRTDALNTKGYIEKRQVQAKSAKTSLCIFSRFITGTGANAEVLDATLMQPRDVIDIDAFCQGIFRVLKQYQIISRNDLKDELGFNGSWRRRILSRTIRRFEAIGCVQRVKARSQFHEAMKSLHPCVMLVREPTESDMKLFKNDYKALFSAADQENEDAEEQAETQSSDHTPIKWTPDVNLPNLVASLVANSGTNGSTNAQIIKEGFGKIFRRPSEHTLNRITEGWQVSQPLHLRHSAIVRDIAIQGTITHYVHYSYPHFKELVDTGRADWEAVTFRPRDARSSKLSIPPPDAPCVRDEDGLAPLQPPRKGAIERDHYCLISAKGLGNYTVTKSDPVPEVNEEGHIVASFELLYGYRNAVRSTAIAHEPSRPPENVQDENLEIVDSKSEIPTYRVPTTSAPMTKFERIEAELKRGNRSAREIYAAFGMDESWTHVAVHLMERTAPGVYVTAKGKARPANKRQGRPKESRIAIFKSASLVDYLRSLPQLTTDTSSTHPASGDSSNIDLEDTIVSQQTEPAKPSSQGIALSSVTERRLSTSQVNAVNNSPPRPVTTVTMPALDVTISEATPTSTDEQERDIPEDMEQSIGAVTLQNGDLKVIKREQHQATSSTTVLPSPERRAVNEDSETTQSPSVKSQTPLTFPKSRRLDREGSVARLRRSIIMNIVEQAGGAFPAGAELWYAFATAWMKRLNHAEKPDSRTVKNVVKYLIDGGKLCEMTFSGKGPKGLMVTRRIIRKPDVSPSDPLVTKMQEGLLKSNYFVPNNVEIDPDVAKLVRGGTGAPTGVYQKQVPVEPSITVNLRNKPAIVLAQEKRREASLQKRMMKPIRLMGIKRKGRNLTTEGITSFSRPTMKISRARFESLEDRGLSGHDENAMDIDIAEPSAKRRPHRESDRPPAEIKRRKRKHDDSDIGRFLNHLDDVSHWERSTMDTEQSEFSNVEYPHDSSGFIHHTVPQAFEPAPIAGRIHFVADGSRKRAVTTSASKQQRNKLLGIGSSKSRLELPVLQPAPPAAERRQLEPIPDRSEMVQDSERISPEPSTDHMYIDESPELGRKVATSRRRRRGLKDMPRSSVERMKFAIIVVRTIAGGPHQKIEWEFVAKAFPEEDPELIIMNAKLLNNRERRQLARMQDDFRVKLLAEFRKRKPALPSIDFNNMASFDWDAVVTWATAQHYTPLVRDVLNLPGSRAQFKQRFKQRVDQATDEFDSIYGPHPNISVAKRASMYSSRPYLNVLKSVDDLDHDQNGTMDVAKSWILANVVAKEETYDKIDATHKLSCFPGDMIDDAIKELTRDRFISQANRGRNVPGRNYCLTDTFSHSFGRKRTIDAGILKRASKFKRVLDDDFRRDGISQVKYNALDGDVLVIMALAAEGRVHILPSDPPANPFGLTEGNYETRALDKAKFKFQVDVIPDGERYEYGNPVCDRISKSRMPISDDEIKRLFNNDEGSAVPDKLPLWLDINGNVHKQLWESILSSVVGILAIRPKLDLKGMQEQLQGFLALWDIERVLNWLEQIEIAAKEDGGGGNYVWTLKEYWWMILG